MFTLGAQKAYLLATMNFDSDFSGLIPYFGPNTQVSIALSLFLT